MSGLFHVSTRDHSALILMSALASSFLDGVFLSLDEIARDMHLSQGYLEEIAGCLKRAGLIQGKQGPGGGYRLARDPKQISLEQILTAIEGPIELVDCQAKGVACPVAHKCASKHVWRHVQQAIQTSLRDVSLQEVVE